MKFSVNTIALSCASLLMAAAAVPSAHADHHVQNHDRGGDHGRDDDRGHGGHHPRQLGIIYGTSDHCDDGKIEFIVDERTRCDSIPGVGNNRAWSVKIDGQCRDISDTTVSRACTAIQAAGAPNVIYGASDSCDDTKIEAVLDDYTRCEDLSPTDRSWSVKINGQCHDISDTNVRAACTSIVAAGARNVVYGKTDTCDDTKIIAVLNDRSQQFRCEDLSSNDASWSVKIDGQCRDISDTNAVSACRMIQVQGIRNAVYGKTDTCDDTRFAFPVNRHTDCNAVDPTGVSWSVKIDGHCRDVSDTNFRSACLLIRSEIQN